MSKLLDLADRVEALEGPYREVFCAAFRAAFPEVSAGAWDAIDAWDAKYDRFCAMLDLGAYLDAAMTLVPEGCGVMLFCFGGDGSGEAQVGNSKGRKAATPALALCAASLRSRHAVEGEGHD